MKNEATGQRTGQQNRADDLRRAVMKFLRWDEMAYNTFQYESGLAYLKHYLRNDEHAVNSISATADFWKWWRNHWTNRDQAFIEFVINTTYSTDEMHETYNDVHDALTLSKAIYPNGRILQESYAMMIKELIQHETQKV
jgi:hypothetical protein